MPKMPKTKTKIRSVITWDAEAENLEQHRAAVECLHEALEILNGYGSAEDMTTIETVEEAV